MQTTDKMCFITLDPGQAKIFFLSNERRVFEVILWICLFKSYSRNLILSHWNLLILLAFLLFPFFFLIFEYLELLHQLLDLLILTLIFRLINLLLLLPSSIHPQLFHLFLQLLELLVKNGVLLSELCCQSGSFISVFNQLGLILY